jgi:hypothetical protein
MAEVIHEKTHQNVHVYLLMEGSAFYLEIQTAGVKVG